MAEVVRSGDSLIIDFRLRGDDLLDNATTLVMLISGGYNGCKDNWVIALHIGSPLRQIRSLELCPMQSRTTTSYCMGPLVYTG